MYIFQKILKFFNILYLNNIIVTIWLVFRKYYKRWEQ